MPRKYRNPPIQEAICEFRFSSDSPWDLAIPGLMYELLKDQFPNRKQIDQLQFEISVGSPPLVGGGGKVRFMREDEKHFVQVAPRLLSINQLLPYESWEQFFPTVEKAFTAYNREAKPKGFARIGLRFINLILIPAVQFKLEEYFRFHPQVPSELPGDFSAFRCGTQFSFNDARDFLKVELTSTDSKKEDVGGFLLDFDYSLRKPEQLSCEQALDWVQMAHRTIEDTFEICIQETTRNLFGPIS